MNDRNLDQLMNEHKDKLRNRLLRPHGSCPGLEELADYAEGNSLTTRDHVRECPACAVIVRNLAEILARARNLHTRWAGFFGPLMAASNKLCDEDRRAYEVHKERCQRCVAREGYIRAWLTGPSCGRRSLANWLAKPAVFGSLGWAAAASLVLVSMLQTGRPIITDAPSVNHSVAKGQNGDGRLLGSYDVRSLAGVEMAIDHFSRISSELRKRNDYSAAASIDSTLAALFALRDKHTLDDVLKAIEGFESLKEAHREALNVRITLENLYRLQAKLETDRGAAEQALTYSKDEQSAIQKLIQEGAKLR